MKEIKVFGSGCRKCNLLAETVEKVAKELGIEYRLEKVTDLEKIANLGVMGVPVLMINGEIKTVGKIPQYPKIKAFLEE